MENKTFITVVILKETEKAINFETMVSWNGNTHMKTLWCPKSVADVQMKEVSDECYGNAIIGLPNWFTSKMRDENKCGRYGMKFEMIY